MLQVGSDLIEYFIILFNFICGEFVLSLDEPINNAQLIGAEEYPDCISAEEQDPFSNEYPDNDTKLHLMVMLESWSFEECGVPLRCHYSRCNIAIHEYVK